MALERETAAFRLALPALLADPHTAGKYALVYGDAVDGTWPTLDEALQAGYDRFGLEPFLVRQVVAKEETLHFSRNVQPCR